MRYTKQELNSLETIEQDWSGSELKIEEDNVRVWLNPRENRQHDGDYTVETRRNNSWTSKNYHFEY